MAGRQYDVSRKLQRLFQEKTKIREAVRQKVIAQENCPYRNPAESIDPAVIRYHAMLTYRPEYMYPTTRNTSVFCFFILLPIVVVFWSMENTSRTREKLYRTGRIAYKDRQFFQVL